MQGIKYNKGDKIIWNSGYGYDVGVYVRELKEKEMIFSEGAVVELKTGTIHGTLWVNLNELISYNKNNHNKMVKRYGYIKDFK